MHVRQAGQTNCFRREKDHSLRMCVDYRALNNITINDLLDQLHGASVLSSLGLQSVYSQIRIKDEDVPKNTWLAVFSSECSI